MSKNGILPAPTRLQHQGLLLSPITFWHQGITCAGTNLFSPTFCDNLLNVPYSISASLQVELSINGNFPYRLLIIVEKYHIKILTCTSRHFAETKSSIFGIFIGERKFAMKSLGKTKQFFARHAHSVEWLLFL